MPRLSGNLTLGGDNSICGMANLKHLNFYLVNLPDSSASTFNLLPLFVNRSDGACPVSTSHSSCLAPPIPAILPLVFPEDTLQSAYNIDNV